MRDVGLMAAIAAVYFGAGILGLRFATLHAATSAIWPPTGLAFAALLLAGRRMWPAIFAGAFLVNIMTVGPVTALFIACGNTGEAFLGAYLIERYANGRHAFERAPDIFRFCALGALLSTSVSATVGATTLAVGGSAPWEAYGAIWLTWWLGDGAGALLVTPLLLIWIVGPRSENILKHPIEALILAGVILLTGQTVFGGHLPSWMVRYPLAFATVPVLVWAAYRFEQAGAASSVVLLAVSAIAGTLQGLGPFAIEDRNHSLLLLQAFLAVMAVTKITLGALVRDTRRGMEEREQLRAEASRLYHEAESANRAKDRFLATLSHELRTPLNAVLGWATLLRDGRLDRATTERALEAVERNTKVQAQLIEDLLDISRIVSGKLRLALQPVSLRQVIQAAIEDTQGSADAKHITLRTHLNPDVRTLGDPERLQQVVWNLLSNAIKFTPTGGRIDVHLESGPSTARIAVSDTGVGIDPAFVPFIFDRFRQSDETWSQRQGGLGLGLTIVRELAELHGGSVSATSEGEGKGATLTVTLPRTGAPLDIPAAPEAPAASVTNSRSQTLTDVRVLVVEDHVESRELLQTCLERAGAVVMTATRVDEALSLLAREPFDVLVSDIGLPGDDGYSLIRQLRAREAGARPMPAVAVSAFARGEDRDQALEAGFQLHVAKPVRPVELVTAVAGLVGER